MFTKKFYLWYLIPFVVFLIVNKSFCMNSDDSRKELTKLGIDYTDESFFKCITTHNLNCVTLFLDSGMSPNAKNSKGRTALMFAASSGDTSGGDISITNLLVEKGADVNAKDAPGLTPLMYAVFGKKTEIVNVLLEKGADINAKSNKGITALFIAITISPIEMIKVLLDKGADVNISMSNNNITILDMARANAKGNIGDNASEIFKLLQNAANNKTNLSSSKTNVIKHSSAGTGFEYYNVSLKTGTLGNQCIGEMTNNSEKNYQVANFILRLFDSDEKLLGTAYITISNFESGDTKTFQTLVSDVSLSNVSTYKIQFENGL